MIAMLDGKGEPGDGGYYVDMSHDFCFLLFNAVKILAWCKIALVAQTELSSRGFYAACGMG